VAFLSKIGFGWYVIAPMALVCLVSDGRIVAAAVSLGVASFAFQWRDNVFDASFPMPDLLAPDRFWIFLLVATITGVIGLMTLTQTRRLAWRGFGGPSGR
jgi:hypothetical protein